MKRQYIILSVLSLILVTIGLLSSWSTPCSGYEANLYAETPLLFWIGLASCYLVGIAFTLISTFKPETPRLVPYLGYLQLALASISLMALQIIRGYKLLNISGDTGTHIGRINTILSTGNLPNTYYPNIYSEPVAFQLLSGVSADVILQILPIISLCIFTLGIHIIAKHIFPNSGEVYFATVVAFFLPWGSAIVVSSYELYYVGMTIPTLVMLPLFIYLTVLCLKGNKLCFIPLTIVGLSTVFYHPHVAIMVLSISAVALFISIIHRIKYTDISASSILKLCVPFAVTLFGFFVHQWDFFSGTITSGINKVFGVFFNKEGPTLPPVVQPVVPPVENPNPSSPPSTVIPGENIPIGGDAVDIGPTITQPTVELNFIDNILVSIGDFLGVSYIRTAVEYGYSIDTVFQIAGINIFIYGMLFIAVCILLWKYMRDERYFYLKVVYLGAIAMFPLMLVALVGDVVGGWGRFKSPIYIAALLSCGFVLYRLYLKITAGGIKNTAIRLGSIFIILSLVCGMSVYAFHPSPNTLRGSYQTTQVELTGTETLLPLIGYDYGATTGVHFRSMQRYVTAHYDSLSLPNRNDAVSDGGLPPHFGYDTGALSLADNIRDGKKYVVVTERDFEYYQAYHSQIMQYRHELKDYEHLSVDAGIHYVYENGGFCVYELF